MFSCEYCKTFKNTYFEEHLQAAAFVPKIILILFTTISESREETITVQGYIQLPPQSEIKENSCLSLKVTDSIQCNLEENGCGRKVYYKEKLHSFEKTGDRIRYRIKVKVDSETLFEIETTINNGWCGDAIRKGDFLNDEAHSIERRQGNTDIRKDIILIQYGSLEKEEGKINI